MQEQVPPKVAPIQWSDARPHLDAEVRAARTLYEIVDVLSHAVTAGSSPAELHELIEEQEKALTEARTAAERRRQSIGDLGPLPERMQHAPQPERDELDDLLDAGTKLRSQLEERIRETSYVARKTASWCDNHRTFLIEEVLRTQDGGLYRAPGALPTTSRPQSVSASLDRTV